MKSFLLVAFLVFAFCNAEAQSVGMLDKKFGDDGLLSVNKPLPGTNGASVILKDDKIVVLNAADENGRIFSRITRFLPDGHVDSSFSKNGSQEILRNILGFYSLSVQADNKLVLASNSKLRYFSVVTFFRFLADGTPDSSFGIDGIYVDSAEKETDAFDATLQPDGKIVVCGQYVDDGDNGFIYPLVARYNQDGTPDKSFGVNGKTILPDLDFLPYSIALQTDGKIVCAGDDGSQSEAILVRYNVNGSIDESFGINGLLKTQFTRYGDFFTDIAIQPDNKIVAIGTAQYNSGKLNYRPQMAIARYNSNGALDETFDQDGKAMIPFAIYTLGKSVALQPDGKMVVAGTTGDDDFDFCVGRLNTDGNLDTVFGTGGKTITDINEGSYDEVYQVGLQSTGDIIVSGTTATDNLYSGLLARYNGDPVKQQSPIVKKIKRWIRNRTLNWQYNSTDVDYFVIEQSSNGVNGFKEVVKVKAVNRQSLNVNDVYTYNLNDFANSQQLKANNKTYYRITAVSNNNKIVSTVISDEDVISITISPNPVKDVMKISGLPANQKTTINIVNRNGNILQSAICNSSVYMMNIAELKSGLYNVQVTSNGKTQTLKFVKE